MDDRVLHALELEAANLHGAFSSELEQHLIHWSSTVMLVVLGMQPLLPGFHSTIPAAHGRQLRLQGARRGRDALSADSRRRRALHRR